MNNYEDLKNLLNSDEDDEVNFTKLLESLGIDPEELNNMYTKISLEYTSDNEKELSYAYPTDSGFDVYSSQEIEIGPFGRALVPTGIRFNLPPNHEIQVRSKSGLALKQGLMVLNSPGTVDNGYTGEVQVIVFNTNNHIVMIPKGMKVGQAVLCPVVNGKWVKK